MIIQKQIQSRSDDEATSLVELCPIHGYSYMLIHRYINSLNSHHDLNTQCEGVTRSDHIVNRQSFTEGLRDMHSMRSAHCICISMNVELVGDSRNIYATSGIMSRTAYLTRSLNHVKSGMFRSDRVYCDHKLWNGIFAIDNAAVICEELHKDDYSSLSAFTISAYTRGSFHAYTDYLRVRTKSVIRHTNTKDPRCTIVYISTDNADNDVYSIKLVFLNGNRRMQYMKFYDNVHPALNEIFANDYRLCGYDGTNIYHEFLVASRLYNSMNFGVSHVIENVAMDTRMPVSFLTGSGVFAIVKFSRYLCLLYSYKERAVTLIGSSITSQPFPLSGLIAIGYFDASHMHMSVSCCITYTGRKIYDLQRLHKIFSKLRVGDVRFEPISNSEVYVPGWKLIRSSLCPELSLFRTLSVGDAYLRSGHKHGVKMLHEYVISRLIDIASDAPSIRIIVLSIPFDIYSPLVCKCTCLFVHEFDWDVDYDEMYYTQSMKSLDIFTTSSRVHTKSSLRDSRSVWMNDSPRTISSLIDVSGPSTIVFNPHGFMMSRGRDNIDFEYLSFSDKERAQEMIHLCDSIIGEFKSCQLTDTPLADIFRLLSVPDNSAYVTYSRLIDAYMHEITPN